MMSSQLANSWKVVRPHIPLIKFRKGNIGVAGDVLPPPPRSTEPQTFKKKGVNVQILEEWQVPASYKRPPFTEEEIEYINRGGPA